MRFLMDRLSVVSTYLVELGRRGLPEFEGDLSKELVILIDGVGGFQCVPLLVRKVLREAGAPIGSTWFRWQVPVPGLILVDLMWHRRNRVMAARLARKIRALHRDHPGATIHLVAYSGGTGISLFALERLCGRVPIETLVLACPAVSPTYNLAPALQNVRRAYGLISHRDWLILGLGTTIFGTMDRRYERSAGMVGFRPPAAATAAEVDAYSRFREIHWHPGLRQDGHSGGHTGWAAVRFLRRHLLPILSGNPPTGARPLDLPTVALNNSSE